MLLISAEVKMALALECATAITSTGRDKLKCKKCREVLLFKPDHEYRYYKYTMIYIYSFTS